MYSAERDIEQCKAPGSFGAEIQHRIAALIASYLKNEDASAAVHGFIGLSCTQQNKATHEMYAIYPRCGTGTPLTQYHTSL
jgi:hypothetical protein